MVLGEEVDWKWRQKWKGNWNELVLRNSKNSLKNNHTKNVFELNWCIFELFSSLELILANNVKIISTFLKLWHTNWRKKSVVHLYCKKDPNDENITFHTSFCKSFFNTFYKNLKFGGTPRNIPQHTGWETLLYSQFLSRLVSTLIFLPPNSVKTNSRLHRRIFLVLLKRPRFSPGHR